MTSETLLPCPFCGAEAKKHVGRFMEPEIRCSKDCTTRLFATIEGAAEAWNRRATPPDGPVVTIECDRFDGELRLHAELERPGVWVELDPADLGLAPGACQRFRLAPEGET